VPVRARVLKADLEAFLGNCDDSAVNIAAKSCCDAGIAGPFLCRADS
jgi:hypothetical protein